MSMPTLTAGPDGTLSAPPFLARLYLGRGILAMAWAAVFAHVSSRFDENAIGMLIVYPLIDAAASWIDLRRLPVGSLWRVTFFNGWLSTVAAFGLGSVGTLAGPSAALGVFGMWAIVSGTAQVVVGVMRRGKALGKQWAMLIAGTLSILVGITYDVQAVGPAPALNILAVYATGGGIFFVIQAALLSWRSRRRHVVRVSRVRN